MRIEAKVKRKASSSELARISFLSSQNESSGRDIKLDRIVDCGACESFPDIKIAPIFDEDRSLNSMQSEVSFLSIMS